MKTVYAWVATFPNGVTPEISVDLFFSSEEEFYECLGYTPKKKHQLVPIQVDDNFSTLDFIPDNY